MLRRFQRLAEHERDTERGSVYRAARLYAEEQKPQQAIAEELDVSVSTVSRWLGLAVREGILQTRAVPPLSLYLEQKLLEIFGREEMTVSVVPNGPGKNIQALGEIGAKHVLDAILAQDHPSKDVITIALSCGTTVSEVVKRLIKLLEDRQAEGRRIRQRLELCPAVLFADSELHQIYPHTIVAYFAMLSRDAELTTAGGDPLISAFTHHLPEGFYQKEYEAQRKVFQRDWPKLGEFVKKIESADIFVVGAGNVDFQKDSYGRIIDQLGINAYVKELLAKDHDPIQVLYAPLSKKTGLPDEKISGKIIGVTVDRLQDISRSHNKRVILVAGGSDKINAMQRVIQFPCYNVLVTDVGVATEAVQQQVSGR